MVKHEAANTAGPIDSDLQGYGTNYVPRAYARDRQLHTRHPSKPGIEDVELAPMKYIALALVHLHEKASALAKLIQDRSRTVDQYQPQTLIPDISNVLTLQPDYEVNENIESIILTGPPAGAVTLQLGDRVWPLVIPATGILVIGPVSIRLGRSDVRQLTATVAGDYNLELMGYADNRGGM